MHFLRLPFVESFLGQNQGPECLKNAKIRIQSTQIDLKFKKKKNAKFIDLFEKVS